MRAALSHLTIDQVGLVAGKVVEVGHELAEGSKAATTDVRPGVLVALANIEKDAALRLLMTRSGHRAN